MTKGESNQRPASDLVQEATACLARVAECVDVHANLFAAVTSLTRASFRSDAAGPPAPDVMQACLDLFPQVEEAANRYFGGSPSPVIVSQALTSLYALARIAGIRSDDLTAETKAQAAVWTDWLTVLANELDTDLRLARITARVGYDWRVSGAPEKRSVH